MLHKALAVAVAAGVAFSIGELSRTVSTGIATHFATSAAQGILESRMSDHVAGLCRRGGAHTEVACRRQAQVAEGI
jgi:hypothetical protein